jgi:hypothetical protein
LLEELEEFDKKGLKKFIEENELDIKTKGLEEEEIITAIVEAMGASDADNDEDEHELTEDEQEAVILELESLKKKGLMKYIRDNELEIEVDDEMDALNIRIAILNELGINKTEQEEEGDEMDDVENEEADSGEIIVNGAYLAGLNRDQLIEFINEYDLDIKVKKKHTDIKICNKILEALGIEEPEKTESKSKKEKKKKAKK